MTREQGQLCVALARASLEEAFGGPKAQLCVGAPFLQEEGACFISLREGDALRGCIGSVRARRPLFEDVVENAKASAFEDPRFAPLRAVELSRIRIEVSVLTPLEPLEAADEADALRKIRVGVDGIHLSWGGRGALFIPAMWEQLPDARTFLQLLRRKAGLPEEWLEGTRLQRFTAEKFEEEDEVTSSKVVAPA